MKRIQLTAIDIANFKGVQQLHADFNGDTSISGANGTGKSTINEAYLWCLFGKNQFGNVVNIQPWDSENNPVHNMTTEVTIKLNVDGFPVAITRRQFEKWSKPRGSSELKLAGREIERLINGVPMKESDFNNKLGEFCCLEDWFMLSSINIIPAMKQEDRRAKLVKIAPEVNIYEIVEAYPEIKKALAEGKTVQELKVQTKATQKKAQDELDQIPVRIDQQRKLRVDKDFSLIEKQIEECKAQISSLQSEIDSVGSVALDTTKADELKKQMADVERTLMQIESSTRKETSEKQSSSQLEIQKMEFDVKSKENLLTVDKEHKEKLENELLVQKDKLQELRDKWSSRNAEAWSDSEYEKPKFDMKCPTCGQIYPEYMQAQMEKQHRENWESEQQAAKEKWTSDKMSELDGYVKDATTVKIQIQTLEENIKHCDSEMESIQQEITSLHERLVAANACASVILTYDSALASNLKYKEAQNRRSQLLEKINAEIEKNRLANQDTDAKKAELRKKQDDAHLELERLQTELSGRETNRRIDELEDELKGRTKELAQLIADCENIETQIADFKKEYIMKVESGASSFFELVRWKMYKANVSNDNEQEICQAVIDGVPFEEQNRAMQFNAAVDIINGFSKALGYSVPLFIDNKESVSQLIQTAGQVITLEVVPGSELTITQL